MRARRGAPARVADHSREIADDQHRMVAEVLKLSQFSKDNRVAKVNIGAGRIDSELHAQRTSERELRPQFILANDLGRASFENRQRIVLCHQANCSGRFDWPQRFLTSASPTCSCST